MKAHLKHGDNLHKEFPKTKAKKDFWGQVSRTVHGTPVTQEHIDMIISTINHALEFNPSDVLLDLGCGNGALSQYLFKNCSKFLGVDFSEYLIQIAKENFESHPNYAFKVMNAVEYIDKEENPEQFSKALCYGAFSYLSHHDSTKLLQTLNKRFTNIERFYIGNLPDKDKAHLFYPQDTDFTSLLSERESPIGIWRSQKEFCNLANETGWNVSFSTMPKSFYSAHYRFDALLTRDT